MLQVPEHTPAEQEAEINAGLSPLVIEPTPFPLQAAVTATEDAAAPVPVRVTTKGLLGSTATLEVTVTVADSATADVGLNWNGIVQVCEAPNTPLQAVMLLLEKSALPLSTAEVIAMVEVPVLMMVTFCAGLLVPVCTEPKLMLLGATAIAALCVSAA